MSTEEGAPGVPTIVSATPEQALTAVDQAKAGEMTLEAALAHVNAALGNADEAENPDLLAAKAELEELVAAAPTTEAAPPDAPAPDAAPPAPTGDGTGAPEPDAPAEVPTVAVPAHDAETGGWPNDWTEYRPTGTIRAKLMQDAFVVADGSAQGRPGDYYVIYLDEHGEPRATSPFAVFSEEPFVAAFDVAK